jgi:hypothetical protein
MAAPLRYLRKAQSEGKDTAFLEPTCAFYVAWMGRYIGAGSQSLHDTIYHDGLQGPDSERLYAGSENSFPFRIYKLDKRNAFADVHDAEAKEMVYSRTVAGGRMLRDLV